MNCPVTIPFAEFGETFGVDRRADASPTRGYGASANVSTIVPSVTVNGSIPDKNLVPQPSNTRVSSIEAGIGSPGVSAAMTHTWTPEEIATFLNKYGPVGLDFFKRLPKIAPELVTPAMGPEDELSPFAISLRSGAATIDKPENPPVRYLSSRYQTLLGDGTVGWDSSLQTADPQPVPLSQGPGGLLGLLLDYQRSK